METAKLFMVLLGATPEGRFTEQHDVFFGIASSLKELASEMLASWPEAKRVHIDAWREVTLVEGWRIEVLLKEERKEEHHSQPRVFFLNLGGYKPGEFEEFHYKILCVAPDKGAAIRQAKDSAFYRHTGFKGAESHIDDKYGIDVDDVYELTDILSPATKQKYGISIHPAEENMPDDGMQLGYLTMDKLMGRK